MRAMLGNAGLYVITKGMVSVCVLGLVRGTSEALCIWVLRKVVVAASNKVIYKFFSTHYVIVVIGANAAKAKCKAVRNRRLVC